MRAIIETWHNGDYFTIYLPETGEGFVRYIDQTGGPTPDMIVVSSYSRERVLNIVRRGLRDPRRRVWNDNPAVGGVPVPYHASDFCSRAEVELTAEELEYLRRLREFTTANADDPYAALAQAPELWQLRPGLSAEAYYDRLARERMERDSF